MPEAEPNWTALLHQQATLIHGPEWAAAVHRLSGAHLRTVQRVCAAALVGEDYRGALGLFLAWSEGLGAASDEVLRLARRARAVRYPAAV